MVRVVFDTVVFVRSLINYRSWWGRLVFDAGQEYHLIVSKPIVLEILQVLRRPELTKLFRTLPGRDPATIISLLDGAETVDLSTVPSVSRDPKDDIFLATAKAGRADYLVSEDRDLLDIGEYEGTQIITAAAFLEILDAGNTER